MASGNTGRPASAIEIFDSHHERSHHADSFVKPATSATVPRALDVCGQPRLSPR